MVGKPVVSTAVASVDAADSGGRSSDFSERLGLASEVAAGVPSGCVATCSCWRALSHANLKTQTVCEVKRTDLGQLALCSSHLTVL
jgi:hypothetical protein